MFTLYCVILGIVFYLLNKANDYLCNGDITTYSTVYTITR